MINIISKLRKNRIYEDDKIKISFSTGSISNSLAVYIKDGNGGSYHVLWLIHPDRCHQNFDKSNDKVRNFVGSKVREWLGDEEKAGEERKQAILYKERNENETMQGLLNSF